MNINIAVAGTGYVGMSIATLLAQHNHVTAVDVIGLGRVGGTKIADGHHEDFDKPE